MTTLTTILYLAVPYTAFGAGMMTRGDARARVVRQAERLPLATIALCCLVGIPSLLQLPFPRLLYALRRDGDQILHHGELWRLFTALVVQDGGTAGLVGNLLILALVGVLAERIWGSWRAVALFLGTGILSEFVGLAWQPIGAGNSVANFGLASSVLLCCLLRASSIPPRVLSAVGIASGLALLLARDIHGGATAIGLCLSAGLLALS
ncbi:MAG: rhomboid family intramembrane serine protease [Thermomicrobiales bacterium]